MTTAETSALTELTKALALARTHGITDDHKLAQFLLGYLCGGRVVRLVPGPAAERAGGDGRMMPDAR